MEKEEQEVKEKGRGRALRHGVGQERQTLFLSYSCLKACGRAGKRSGGRQVGWG